MKRFLLGALAMGAFVVLTSFALHNALPESPFKRVWTVADYRLDRAFRVPISFGSGGASLTSQVPSTGGLLITEIAVSSGGLVVTVNGVEQYNVTAGPGVQSLNPPIIVRPGDALSLTNPSGSAASGTISGYRTLPGET